MGGEEMQQQIVIKDVSHTNSEIVCSKNQIESFVKRQQTIMDKLTHDQCMISHVIGV